MNLRYDRYKDIKPVQEVVKMFNKLMGMDNHAVRVLPTIHNSMEVVGKLMWLQEHTNVTDAKTKFIGVTNEKYKEQK